MKGQVVVLGIPHESKEKCIEKKRGYEILLSSLLTSNVVRVNYILTSMYFLSIFIYIFCKFCVCNLYHFYFIIYSFLNASI